MGLYQTCRLYKYKLYIYKWLFVYVVITALFGKFICTNLYIYLYICNFKYVHIICTYGFFVCTYDFYGGVAEIWLKVYNLGGTENWCRSFHVNFRSKSYQNFENRAKLEICFPKKQILQMFTLFAFMNKEICTYICTYGKICTNGNLYM